jgi:hypothetical protein
VKRALETDWAGGGEADGATIQCLLAIRAAFARRCVVASIGGARKGSDR